MLMSDRHHPSQEQTMPRWEPYARAEDLEQYLGDPFDPERPLSFARTVEADEREEYPEAAHEELGRWGFHRAYFPAHLGGWLDSMEEFLALIRVLARRDYTAAVAHLQTFQGCVSVWVSGSDLQKQRMAAIVENRERVSFALTERDHGADVLANEVEAVRVPRGYLLSGEKWLINNATRATTLTVYAKTSERGGPRGYSLFLVEKKDLNPASYRHLPKVKTHGIRGADISGICFEGSFVPEGTLIGAVGSGLETTLKGFQVTRTLVAGLSLGAADTALRAAIAFALGRRLYGGRAADIPLVREQLAGTFIDVLICECVALGASRALHTAPGQMSVWSAVSKYFVPVRVEALVRELAILLGARHYLREGHYCGLFQKLMRDNAVAGLFDGSTIINLNAISQQLGQLYELRAEAGSRLEDEAHGRLEVTFDLRQGLPRFDPDALDLTSRGRDDLLCGLDEAVAAVPGVAARLPAEVRRRLVGGAARLLDEARELRRLTQGSRGHGNAFGQPAVAFEMARRHCTLVAAASCLRMWLHNQAWASEFFAEGEWLAIALHRLLPPHGPGTLASHDGTERCLEELMRLYRENRLFSVVPCQLAGPRRITEASCR
jgi:alkylation response protein AidB-like acyl-CoA dehydrogenase